MNLAVDLELENLQRQTFDYFLYKTHPDNGLVIDSELSCVGLLFHF